MSTFSITETAKIIGEAHGWDDKAKAKIHRQLKYWRSEGLLTPAYRNTDGRGTDLLNNFGVCHARLLLALSDVGFDVADLRHANDDLKRSNALENTLGYIIAGVPTEFVCRASINRDGIGRKISTVRILIQGSIPPRTPQDNYEDLYLQAEVEIFISAIMRPVLDCIASV